MSVYAKQIIGLEAGNGMNIVYEGDNVVFNINPLRSIPLNFRFNDPNGSPTSTTNTSFVTVGTFSFRGTDDGDNIQEVHIVVSGSTAGVGTQVRLFNYTDNSVIGTSGIMVAPDATYRDYMELYIFQTEVAGNVVTVENGASGTRTDIPGAGATAPLTFAVTAQGTNGADGAPPTIAIREVSTIDTTGATPAALDGTWFAVYFGNSPTDYYFFWFDTDDSGTAQPANPLTTGGNETIFEINTIVTGDSEADIATKIGAALDISPLNLPAQRAIIDIQIRKTSAGGGSAEIHNLQMYG